MCQEEGRTHLDCKYVKWRGHSMNWEYNSLILAIMYYKFILNRVIVSIIISVSYILYITVIIIFLIDLKYIYT